MKFAPGYIIIRPILKTVSAAAIALCLLAAPASYAAATDTGTEWKIKAGDTPAGIAHSIFPGNAPMRDKLARAIIAANPAVFPDGKPANVAIGTVITIPDLRTLGSTTASPAPEIPSMVQQPSPHKSKPVSVKSSEGMGAAAVAMTEKPVATTVLPAIQKPKPSVAEMPLIPPQEQAAPGKLDIGGGFRLKLATGVMDLSVIGKLSEEELKHRREGQLLLDADDPVASFLALRHQIKYLKTQVEELQLKLDLGKNKAAPTATATPAEATMPVVKKPVVSSSTSISFIPAAYTPIPTNDTLELIKYALTLYLLPVAEITLALLALFLILRYYRNLRSRMAESGELAAAAQNRVLAVLAKKREATADISSFDKNLVISTAAHIEVVEDTDTILQDAQLFVIHGYPDKAIELLEAQVAANHEETRVWMLLFVILRSQGMKEEFDKFARRFRTLIHDQSMWENIQDLGRELDPANSLYFNKRNRRLAAETAATPSHVTPAALFPGVSAIADTPVDFSGAAARSPHDTQDLTAILNPTKK